MSFILLNNIATSLFGVFGGSMVFLWLLVGFIVMILLTINANKFVVFIVTIPLFASISIYGFSSKYLEGLTVGYHSLVIAIWLIGGALMAFIFWKMLS